MATMGGTTAQEKPRYDLHAFGRKMSDPGMTLVKPQAAAIDNPGASDEASTEQEGTVTLRVFAGKALMAPGALYKSVMATPQMTALEIIRQALERYGEAEKVTDFQLMYRRVDDDHGRKGSLSKLFSGKARAHILCDDECPVLVAEWFNDALCRFELLRKVESVPRRWSADSLLGSLRRRSKGSSTHIWTINRNGDGHDPGSGSERGSDSPVPRA
jgi:hypothetical protein